MKAVIATQIEENNVQMYSSIMDDDGDRRKLYIDDERGGFVELHGKEIGDLYNMLKPPMAGK